MPGILTMNPSGVDGASGAREGDSKKRGHDGKLVNGERNAARKDTPTPVFVTGPVSAHSINGASMLSTVPDQVAQLPPELAQLASEFYNPLSKLLVRIGQECYNDLSEVLQKMADLPSGHQANGAMANGYAMTNGGQNKSESSAQKRLLLMQFAQENRAKFIKLLVLTDWGKKSSVDVARLIDLFVWTKEQNADMDSVDFQIEQMKALSNCARQYNPDIGTALEVLATNKAEWISDLNLIPLEPLSAENALKLLRSMNTTLSIRLTVHETLPRHLQKWRVGSGRATFVVDDEFELDLVSFVEDTSQQWFFTDLRFLFTPAPIIAPDSQIMRELKLTLDHALSTDEGLQACFNYLHNFILTHKINVLRSKAFELLRNSWAGSLHVESPHRGLVVQYWADRPGKKSWVEVGVSSNRPKNGKTSWRGPPIASLTARWFRQGEEVKNAGLDFDWRNLSAERIVKRVIALHIGHLLWTTQQDLSPQMVVQPTLSGIEPSDCKLEASMGSPANKTVLSIEPVTGRYILHPVNSLSSGAENAINHTQGARSTGSTLMRLLARSLLDLVQRCAQQLGWQQVARQALRADVVKDAVKLHVLEHTFFWPRGWSSNWALATIVDASGESWWICEIGTKGSTIEYAQRVTMEKIDGCSPPITRATLSGIERVAVHALSLYVTTRALSDEGKRYNLVHDFTQPRHAAAIHSINRGWVLHLKTADLLVTKPGDVPWLEPSMRVTCQGFRSDFRNIWHIATGTMVSDVATDMKKLMSASPQKNFSFSEEGHFSILLCTPFGKDILGELRARLRDVDRLRSFATILQHRRMPLIASSLRHVQFQYGSSLSATVKFGDRDDIRVVFGANNPHQRIHGLLTAVLNSKTPASASLSDNVGLDRFCTSLMLTRPVLTALDGIAAESSHIWGNPSIHAHAVGIYRLSYTNPACSFDIRLRAKEDRALWLVEDNDGKLSDLRPKDDRISNTKRPENISRVLSKLFGENGAHWYGVRTGIVGDVGGIRTALKRLHEAVMSCYVEGAVKLEPNDSSVGPKAVPGNTNGAAASTKLGVSSSQNTKQRPAVGRINSMGGQKVMGKSKEVITID